ncbi:sigma-70 family RNA polymerase sigma factor [Metabacillus endolithicus]|uniref:Sigma-70 family RNA polymerase sigma factor n=1 Tax=Metabacillus endolithicus TaxID=1535204 RepID=A0ABW5BUY4_9BACI|nr:sigma-70 family RNA polymerase sigma factor [Metabacillus endolithicus]UPG63407.1 sigma-70 family RNA polymerase sigma factor [Metabacillus endolithicus]
MKEEKLVKLATKGDPEAFGKLMILLKDQAYRMAYCYLHHEHDSMDAVCNAMEKAFAKLNQLREPKYFKTWFLKIVINESIQLLREKSKIVEVNENEIMNLSEESKSEHIEDLEELLNQVEPTERSMIYMKYYLGYSLDEISKITDLPLSTVKTKIYRNLKQLREKLVQREVL